MSDALAADNPGAAAFEAHAGLAQSFTQLGETPGRFSRAIARSFMMFTRERSYRLIVTNPAEESHEGKRNDRNPICFEIRTMVF